MKRLNAEIQDSSSESFKNKKQKIKDYELMEKFSCSYFYIDKSLLIKRFLEEKSKIICVTGPSGYGKSNNLTMMKYFFEMNYEDKDKKNNENRKLFEKLNIAKEVKDGKRYINLYQGQYPVIYLDFYKVDLKKAFQETLKNFKYFIMKLYKRYRKINRKFTRI